MEIKNTLRKLGLAALLGASMIIPTNASAKSWNLQQVKEDLTQDYEQAVHFKKIRGSETKYYAGAIMDLGKEYLGTHLDANVNTGTFNFAALGTRAGVEYSDDFKKEKSNKSITLDGMVLGTGFSLIGKSNASNQKDLAGTVFRGDETKNWIFYHALDSNKKESVATIMDIYKGPDINGIKTYPYLYATKSFATLKNGYLLDLALMIQKGKISAFFIAEKTDLDNWNPGFKLKYSF